MIRVVFYNFLRILGLFLFGYGTMNILHFFVEDVYQMEALRSFIFGLEYASALSYILILGVFMVLMDVYVNKIVENFDNKNIRLRIISGEHKLIVLFLSFASLTIAGILYSYLSGYTSHEGLIRILVTIGIFFIGAVYCWTSAKRLSMPDFRNIWQHIQITIISLMVLLSTIVTFKMAPPWELRELRKDIATVKKMREIRQAVQSEIARSWLKNKQKGIPTSYLSTQITNNNKNLDTHRYLDLKILSNDSFKLCTEFKGKKTQSLRRLKTPGVFKEDLKDLKPGLRCRIYSVKYSPKSVALNYSSVAK